MSSSSFHFSSSSTRTTRTSSSEEESYEEKRRKAYPTAQDQLDQIFKDLKNGDLKDGEWYKTIAQIKATHEKPPVEKPE